HCSGVASVALVRCGSVALKRRCGAAYRHGRQPNAFGERAAQHRRAADGLDRRGVEKKNNFPPPPVLGGLGGAAGEKNKHPEGQTRPARGGAVAHCYVGRRSTETNTPAGSANTPCLGWFSR